MKSRQQIAWPQTTGLVAKTGANRKGHPSRGQPKFFTALIHCHDATEERAESQVFLQSIDDSVDTVVHVKRSKRKTRNFSRRDVSHCGHSAISAISI